MFAALSRDAATGQRSALRKLAVAGRTWFNPRVDESPPAWEKLLDGRFDSKHPGRTLWNLFSDQRGRVAGAVTLGGARPTMLSDTFAEADLLSPVSVIVIASVSAPV